MLAPSLYSERDPLLSQRHHRSCSPRAWYHCKPRPAYLIPFALTMALSVSTNGYARARSLLPPAHQVLSAAWPHSRRPSPSAHSAHLCSKGRALYIPNTRTTIVLFKFYPISRARPRVLLSRSPPILLPGPSSPSCRSKDPNRPPRHHGCTERVNFGLVGPMG